jgi:beta-xylosidase
MGRTARFSGLAIMLAANLAAAPVHAEEARYTNPILYADYSDPDLVSHGDNFYMVASSFHFSPGIPVLHSRDLVHWRIVNHVLPRLDFDPLYDMPGPHELDDTISKPIGGTKYASGVWAPSIRFHDGRFYVYWATPDEGVFMSSAADPAGEWTAPVQLIAGPGYEDPCPFWDDDGTAWLIHGRVGAGPLVLHRMSADGTRVLDDGFVVAEDAERLPVLEGPKFLKRNGWYYIFAPIGGVPTGPQAVGRSRTITGPYEWRDVLLPGNGLAGPHQGGYVETPEGAGWFAHFNSTGAFGRIVHLQPVIWRDDWPVIGDPLPSGEEGLPVSGGPMPMVDPEGATYRLQDDDEFSSSDLGLQWSWNHNPDNAAWSLTEREGFLRLHALPARQIVNARNTLTQILVGPDREYSARLDVSGMAEGQRAGLSLFGVRPAWIGVSVEHGEKWVTVSNQGVESRVTQLGDDAVVELLAIVIEEQQVYYGWRFAGAEDWNIEVDALPLSQFSWWKGSRPALFSFTRGEAGGEAGFADFDWFRVDRLAD